MELITISYCKKVAKRNIKGLYPKQLRFCKSLPEGELILFGLEGFGDWEVEGAFAICAVNIIQLG